MAQQMEKLAYFSGGVVQKPPDWILTYWLCIGVSTKLISSKRHMLHIGRHTAHRARTTHKLLLHLTHRRSFALKIGLLEDLASRGLIADITRSERRLRVIKYFSLPCTSDLTSSRSTWRMEDEPFMPELTLRHRRCMWAISSHWWSCCTSKFAVTLSFRSYVVCLRRVVWL